MSNFAELRASLNFICTLQVNKDVIDELHKTLFQFKQVRESLDIPISNTLEPPKEPIKLIKEVAQLRRRMSNPGFSSLPNSSAYNTERYLPYRILWAKVIIRATYDYALWKDSSDMRLRKFAEDAERWLFESSDLELSFENICFAFDFPVDKIRKKTRLLTKNDVKKLEFRERQGRPDLGESLDGGGN